MQDVKHTEFAGLQFEPHAGYGAVIDGEPLPFGYISTRTPMPVFELMPVLKYPEDKLRDLALKMAAAPEMFEALRECQKALDSIVGPDAIKATSVSHAYAQALAAEVKARAALSKAEGRP